MKYTRKSPLHWDVGCAMLSAYDADGFLGIQHDAEGEGDSGLHPYEVEHIGGLVHRPLDPVVDDSGIPIEGQSASVLIATESTGVGHIIPLGDPRVTANLLPAAAKGETIVHSSFGQFSRYFADGSIAHCTTDKGGDPSGQTVASWVTPTSFEQHASFGQMVFDATGYRVSTLGGARLTLGYAGGLVPGLGAYARLSADMVSIEGAAVTLAPSGGIPGPVVKAEQLMVVLDTVALALTAIQASLAAPTSEGSGSAAPVAAAVAQIAGALASISTLAVVG